MQNPSIISIDLAKKLSERRERPVAASTIHLNLQNQGLKVYCAKRKPILIKKMKAKRLEWAKKYCDKPISFWENVLFPDESRVIIDLGTVMNRVRRLPWQNPLHSRFIHKTVAHPLKQPLNK